MIQRTLIHILFIISVLLLGLWGIVSSYNYSNQYPLDRIIVNEFAGYTTSFGSIIKPSSIVREVSIVKVGNEFHEGSLFSVSHAPDAQRVIKTKGFGVESFVFLVSLLSIGLIHSLWGIVISIVYGKQPGSQLLSRFSFSIGIFFVSLVLFLSGGFSIPLAVSSLFVWVSTVKMGLVITGGKRSVITEITGVFLVAGVFVALRVFPIHYFAFAAGLVVCAAFVFLMASISYRVSKSPGVVGRNGWILFAGGMVSLVIPIISITIGSIVDTYVPVSYFSSLTVAMPLIMANNLANRNARESLSVRRRYFLGTVIDIMTAVFSSLLLTSSIYLFFVKRNHIPSGVAVLAAVLLLVLRQKIHEVIEERTPFYRKIFSDSMRKISEIAASPGKMTEKIRNIKGIVDDATGAKLFEIDLYEKIAPHAAWEDQDIIGSNRYPKFLSWMEDSPAFLNRNSFFSAGIIEEMAGDRTDIDIVVPIRSETTIFGVLVAGRKNGGSPFAEDELIFINSLSFILYQLIENDLLFREYTEKNAIEREIDIASYIQIRLLPKTVPVGKGITISHFSRPYLKATGDYYDWIDIDTKRTLIVVGDVTGHGPSAASLLAVISTIMHGLVHEGLGISEIMNELNHFFHKRYLGYDLATLFLMIYDATDRSINYINAGHCSPILVRNGNPLKGYFKARSTILGASGMSQYVPSIAQTLPGDKVLIYTDGLIEIEEGRTGHNVGDGIIMETVDRTKNEPVDRLIAMLAKRIGEFPRESIGDDITIVGLGIE